MLQSRQADREEKTVRHGFPYQPTALAFDPVQKILAIGSRTGAVPVIVVSRGETEQRSTSYLFNSSGPSTKLSNRHSPKGFSKASCVPR
ncbi:Syntaxin-binding protein 5-like [Liparis tanakae]|uniref:Syntaxin-binding protein 5-like n=1 Tax=Liparis tanakae TaxID=230148 RepID=A0A4Z2JER3_9TELE|nr:Syntaxin-binding protein 5-like [Liparis tanakae]